MPSMRKPSNAEAEHAFFHEQGPPNPMIAGVNAPVELPPEPSGFLARQARAVQEISGGVAREGVGGLMDVEGMRDRQRAHAELLRKFDIVGEDHQGERLPNQVTQAEYGNVVQTYSDIRLGRSDLKVDPQTSTDKAQFKADAMDDIGDIMQTASGRALISQLSNNKRTDAAGNVSARTTTITPSFHLGTSLPDTRNAYETPIDAMGKNVNSTAGLGAPFASGQSGIGSNTKVSINPNQDISAIDRTTGAASTFRSDVTMFHELTHALHDTQGTTDLSTVMASDAVAPAMPHPGFAADERASVARFEHQAVGLGLHSNNAISENAYRRERRMLGGSHKAMAGDTLMSDREHFTQQMTYNNFFGR